MLSCRLCSSSLASLRRGSTLIPRREYGESRLDSHSVLASLRHKRCSTLQGYGWLVKVLVCAEVITPIQCTHVDRIVCPAIRYLQRELLEALRQGCLGAVSKRTGKE